MKEELKELKTESFHLAGSYYNLAGLKFLRYASKQWSRMATQVILAGLIGMILLFLSFGGAFLIADYFESMAAGFGMVGGFYLLVTFFLLGFKKVLMRDPIRNVFIKQAAEEINWYQKSENGNTE
jgi:membrane-bound ClpP family serine protease